MLDSCLLSEEEMDMGPERWALEIDDPLPAWQVHDGEGVEGEEEYDEEEDGDEDETA